MLNELHDHIIEELKLNTRTDTIFLITALVLNGIFLGANSGLASALSFGDTGIAPLLIFIITMMLSILINGIAIIGLLTGRATRRMLVQGLMKMYEDAEVSQYYHESLLTNYMRRYVMFISVLGLMAIPIPFPGCSLAIPRPSFPPCCPMAWDFSSFPPYLKLSGPERRALMKQNICAIIVLLSCRQCRNETDGLNCRGTARDQRKSSSAGPRPWHSMLRSPERSVGIVLSVA
jgi:hypothetical protein